MEDKINVPRTWIIDDEIKQTWVGDKLYRLGATLLDYDQAVRVKEMVKKDNIKVIIVKRQPPPIWELWAHDMDQGFVGNLLDHVTLENKPIPLKAKISLTTKGHINAATEMAKAGITEEHLIKLGLCDHCQSGSKPGETYICDKGNFPRADKRRCKYHQERA